MSMNNAENLDVLFTPVTLGEIELKNRMVMAPLTRSRANEHDAPSELHAKYYSQRAGAGIIITEGTQPSIHGKGYARTPGIHSPEQIAGWNLVSETVGDSGGSMIMQIMHCGRIGSAHNKAKGAKTVAPSPIQAAGEVYSDTAGMVAYDVPEQLSGDEIQSVIEEYRNAAINARAAGMAGVELHATSGYLPAQFLSTGTNQRKDNYGGSVENRVRFVVEVLRAMADAIGPGRVGMRICPGNPFNALHDDDPEETFKTLLESINELGLAYLHVIRMPKGPVDNIALSQNHFNGPLILNDSYSFAEAAESIQRGEATAISFGRSFIANPDLVNMVKQGGELKQFDAATLYTPGEKGYTDY